MKLEQLRVRSRRRARVLGCAAIACAVAAALPSAGHAAVLTLGSDLRKPADAIEDHGADAAFWNVSIDGVPGAMPADGQITFVRVKGSVVDDPVRPRNPNTLFHFQVLHPVGGGVNRVMLSSGGFHLPVVRAGSGNPQQISGYKPINLCVRKGDYVDFNDFGGFEYRWGAYHGMAVQVFSNTSPNAIVNFYSKGGGTNIGSRWAPQETHVGQELLMQTDLSTGPHSTDFCYGGFKQHVFNGLTVRRETVPLRSSTRSAKIHVQCPGQTYIRCRGVVTLKATLNGGPVTLGGAPFILSKGYNGSLDIKFSQANVNMIKAAKGVTAVVTADGQDDPNADSHARSHGVPIQKKVTTGTVRITPG